MAGKTPSVMPSSVDPYKVLRMACDDPDGSIDARIQLRQHHDVPASVDTSLPVLSKDIPVNPSNGNYVRLFLPRCAADEKLLPLVVHFFGGGFFMGSVRNRKNHEFCSDLAARIPAVVVAVQYRLAPEHRLPAAYEDAFEALQWIGNTPDEWLLRHADLRNCYLMGGSAGGNIAYHLGLQLAESLETTPTTPLKIRGFILLQPGFGGKERTGSKVRMADDPILPPVVTDMIWEISLPAGADRDHEYCNPTAGGGPGGVLLDKIKAVGWRFLVYGCGGDPLIDRQVEFASMLEEHGIPVEKRFEEGGGHGHASAREEALVMAKDFIVSSTSNSISHLM